MLGGLHSTFVGGVVATSILLPSFVLCVVAPLVSSYLLLSSGWYAAEAGQALIALVCDAHPRVGHAGTAAAVAITAAVVGTEPTAHGAIVGPAMWAMMTWANWGHRFAYSPAFSKSMCNLSAGTYFPKCELRGEVGKMGTGRTLYLFHPHGIVTCGFSCNGVWSQALISRTTLRDAFNPSTHAAPSGSFPGTVFFIPRSLHETSAIFKAATSPAGSS